MGRRSGSGSGKSKSRRSPGGHDPREEELFRLVDVARVRFQHSRVRPTFSGCGRSVEGTLESIRRGELSPHDLPPIQVLAFHESVSPAGDPTEQDPWYFSLNNRRLWVLKRCREEGLLLPSNLVRVRARPPKSASEISRYTVQNCALEATLMREPPASSSANAGTSPLRESGPRAGQSPPSENFVADESRAGRGCCARSKGPSNGGASSSDDESLAGTFSNRYSAILD